MTAIQWTDETWNPVTGCTRVSAGCDHCYASTLHNSRYRSNLKKALGYHREDVERLGLDAGAELRELRSFRSATPEKPKAEWDTFPETYRDAEKSLPFPQQYDTPFAVVQTWEHKLREPLTWRKPAKVFTCSMGDLFHEDVPFEFIDKVFAVMAVTPQHTYQVLTKRPERMREYMANRVTAKRVDLVSACITVGREPPTNQDHADFQAAVDTDPTYTPMWPLPNVWLGTSVEDQAAADARIPELSATPAAVRFLSCEPLLGAVDLLGSRYKLPGGGMGSAFNWGKGIDWVITGGESGKGARACDVGWIRSVRDQCRAAGVPVFVKQLGSVVVGSNDDGFEGDTGSAWPEGTRVTFTEGGFQGSPCLVKLRHSHGGDMEEWPEDLRVREFPSPPAPLPRGRGEVGG